LYSLVLRKCRLFSFGEGEIGAIMLDLKNLISGTWPIRKLQYCMESLKAVNTSIGIA
jgi:hypothetical protein